MDRFNLSQFSITKNRKEGLNIGSYGVSIRDGVLKLASTSDLNSANEIKYNYKLVDSDEVEDNFTGLSIDTAGRASQGWYGEGSVIVAKYDDSRVLFDLTITIGKEDISLSYKINYKINCNVEIDGIKINHSIPVFSRDFMRISGDYHYARSAGIYSHNGKKNRQRSVDVEGNPIMLNEPVEYTDEELTIFLKAFTGRSNYFAIRTLLQPEGKDCSFIVSNHADNSHIDPTLAVHYGTSDKESPDFGTKGLIGRGIKTTWSVFSIGSSSHPGFNTDTGLLYEGYKDMVADLRNKGHEICPHGVRGNSSMQTRGGVETELPKYDQFGPIKTWIDHGLSSGIRAAWVSSLGWNPVEDDYIMDILEDAGIISAWSYDDIGGISTVDRLFDTDFGFPNHILYQNKAVKLPISENLLWRWSSSGRVFSKKTLNETTVQNLIDRCGSCDAHEYLSEPSNNLNTTYTVPDDPENDPHLIVDSFDKTLQKLEEGIAAGKIWNPTITEWVEFCIRLKRVSITPNETDINKFTLNNNSGGTINGFSMLVGKKGISATLNGTPINQKTVALGTIIWSDLITGASTLQIM